MNSAAIFKIHTSFNLTGRGVVAYGHLIKGNVLPGYSSIIDFDGHSAKVTIKEIGMGRSDEEGNMSWGLILKFEDINLEKIAAVDRIKEQIITIYTD